jgi:AraC-like DNA-binding protein
MNKAKLSFFEKLASTDMLFQLFETMPYPVAFFKPDGNAAYMNPALCDNLNIANFDELLDKYNLFQDAHAMDLVGLREFAGKIFKGEMARIKDVKMPFGRISEFTRKDELLDESFHLNITGFPLFDEDKKLAYIMCMAHRTATYKGKKEIVEAKKHIDKYWMMEFNAERVADAVELSVRHLDRMFKECTGETPFNYYKRVKIERIKTALADPNLNVEQAFESCCVDYNGTYAQHFRESVGMTPLEYKKKLARI